MDWIAAALNEPAAVPSPMNSSTKEGDLGLGSSELPNFDDFLNPPRRRADAAITTNKADCGRLGPTPTGTAQRFGNVRIHPTEMQRYLQGIMQSSANDRHSSPQDKTIGGHQMKSGLCVPLEQLEQRQQGMDGLSKSGFAVGMGGDGDGGHSPMMCSLSQHPSRGDSSAAPADPAAMIDTGGAASRGQYTGSAGEPSLASGGWGRRGASGQGGGGDGGGGSGSSGSPSSRQKSDKAVEVHHDHRVIARFRTQTECARYLRATPEAVSYHCSKRGGGICNGLVILPLGPGADAVGGSSPEPRFGLFKGAVEHRPKERPQLRPETVAILKDWLLSPDHVDNPYPNQREAEMLMRKTGLDNRMQLKHWFNNGRKRILKPFLKNLGMKGLTAGSSTDKKKRGSGSGGGPRDQAGGGRAPPSGKKKRKGDSIARAGDGVSPLQPEANWATSPSFTVGNGNGVGNSLCGSTYTSSSNLSSEGGRQSQLGHQFEDSYQDFRHGDSVGDSNGNGGSFNMMQNNYERFMEFCGQGMNSSMNDGMNDGMNSNMSVPNAMMMRYGMGSRNQDMMGSQNQGVMSSRNQDMMNSINQGVDFNAGFAGSYCIGEYQGGGMGRVLTGGLGAGAGGCYDRNSNEFDRFDDFPPSRTDSLGSCREGRGQGGFGQDQGLDRAGFDKEEYSQPISKWQKGGQSGGGGAGGGAQNISSDESARSNAVFKQQVATMAMNDASTAFKDMEDAFANANRVLSQSGASHPEDDPAVMEANAHAKECQKVAMFKLKVSQRASEEAAGAYDRYQMMVDGGGGEGGGRGGDDMGSGNDMGLRL